MKMTESTRELEEILTAHARRYPRMLPQDAVKLLYQNEFGGGHLIPDSAASLAALRKESSAVRQQEADTALLREEIGNGLFRIYLTGSETDYPLEQLNRDFIRSAQFVTGTQERFQKKLETLREQTRRGIFRFSLRELEAYLRDYAAAGYPMVSHSDAYRDAYHPAYRVIARSVSLPLFLDHVRALERSGKRVLLALDGRCASGKSTLAGTLAERYGWSVIHMDDFFLRPCQRTAERYAEPGGNLDRERFLSEVLTPLRDGKPVCYRPFDCHTMQLKEPVSFNPAPVVLIEGSYACHPLLWGFYDLRVFLTVDQTEQAERILRRNGPEGAAAFSSRWIPMEERYFTAFSIEERCDYVLRLS